MQANYTYIHRHGNDFSVGGAKFEQLYSWEQKLVKNNQDNQIQSITLCNMYFSKKVYAVYNRSGPMPQKLGNFR